VSERLTFECPIPIVRPLGSRLDKAEYVQEVWDEFVKPEQDAEIPPSVEMRLLMAILRAVAQGLTDAEPEE
jgi:hypothetical protein